MIPKGEKFGSKQGHQRGRNLQVALTMEEVAKSGRNKGDDGFRGRPSQHWMMVSIQASVSDSIFAKFKLALIVLSSITKKGRL